MTVSFRRALFAGTACRIGAFAGGTACRLIALGCCMALAACTQERTSVKPAPPAAPSAVPVHRPQHIATLTIYYAKLDGQTLGHFQTALGTAADLASEAYLAAVSTLTGPPSAIAAVRFPPGTTIRSVHVVAGTAVVDFSKELRATPSGGFSEAGEFKALIWTLTNLPGISHVKIQVAGATVPTLPGGHFELDLPLSRADW